MQSNYEIYFKGAFVYDEPMIQVTTKALREFLLKYLKE